MSATAQQEKLVPDFGIKVRGNDLTRKIKEDLVSLVVDLEVNRVDEAVIKLRNDDFRWSDGGDLAEGSPIEIDFGYEGQEMGKIFSGEVIQVRASFPRRGISSVTVVAHSLLHRLKRQQKSQAYRKVRDSDIAMQIAQAYNLTPEIETSRTKNEFLFQNNQSDLDFLLERAKRVGSEITMEGNKLVFRKPQHDKPKVAELTWSRNLKSFDVRQQVTRQVTSLEVRGWDPVKKKPIVFKTKVGDEACTMGGQDAGTKLTEQAFGETQSFMVDQAIASVEEAEAWARGMWEQASMDFIEGDGACQGDPKLKPGKVVEIKGLGGDFNGSYYLSGTRHVITPDGYRTVFGCKRRSLGQEAQQLKPIRTRPPRPVERAQEEHWIEKQFVDAAGRPVSGLEYSWTLTGENARQEQGTVGADGTLKARNIDPGTAQAVLKEITSAAWRDPRGETGEPVGMHAKTEGFADGTPGEFQIFERGKPEKILATVPGQVQAGVLKGDWTYNWAEGDGVRSFQFVFNAKVGGRTRESNQLDMFETVEVEGKDAQGQPLKNARFALLFADGRVHMGRTDAQGCAKVRGIRPGKHEIYFPSADAQSENWGA